MDELDNRLYEAFDAVRAEDPLKASTMEFLSRKRKAAVSSGSWQKRLAAAACMLVMLVVGFGIGVYSTPVSVVSVDINPSVELGVNRFDRVISVEGYNEDGAELVRGLHLKNRTSADAVSAIVNSSMVRGMIDRNEWLTLTVVGEDPQRNASLQANLTDCISHIQNAQCVGASADEVRQAHACGMSYGKYLAGLKLLEVNDDLTMEDVKGMTMREIHELCGTGGKHHQGKGHHGSGIPGNKNVTDPTETCGGVPAATGHHNGDHSSGHSGKHKGKKH